MKEFLVYTAMRLALFVAAFLLVAGIWALIGDSAHLFGSLVVALLLSGVASYYLLDRQREALARRVEARASAASEAFERRKAHEDED